ncbi:MAG TPA: hypothetical protein PK706_26310 [Xanthobacteraceae bacterium]|nr:hypothetical protein [Xanthobacteraceae bacterium]
MATKLEKWVRIERTIIEERIKKLKDGGKITSPSGEDITKNEIHLSEMSLEGANLVLEEAEKSRKPT